MCAHLADAYAHAEVDLSKLGDLIVEVKESSNDEQMETDNGGISDYQKMAPGNSSLLSKCEDSLRR